MTSGEPTVVYVDVCDDEDDDESCPSDDDHHLSSNLSNAFLENDISSSNCNIATLDDVSINKDACDEKFQQYVINNKLDMIYRTSLEQSNSQVGLGDHNTVSADADSVNDDSSFSSYNWNHISEFEDDPIYKDYKPTEQEKKKPKQKTTSQKTAGQKTIIGKTTSQKKKSCKPFTCTFCEKDFKRLKTLTRHAIRIHKSHLCQTCNKYFSSNKKLKIHTNSTGSVCGEKLTDNGTLNSHMVKHNFQTIFTCLICKCKFKSSETFDQHQINCKSRSESCPTDDDHVHLSSNLSNVFLENDISSSNCNIATLDDVSINKDACDDKFQQYVINNKLDRIYSSIELIDSQFGPVGDYNTVSADAAIVNDDDSSSSSYDWNHISEFEDDPIDKDYKPTEQKKKYTNRKTTSQKRARQKTTSQKTTSQKTASQKTTSQKKDSCKPFTCIFCENDFKRLGTLISHAIRIHKSHLCLTCNKYFSSNKELKIHTDSSHSTGSDSHKDICSVCGDKLVGNGALNSHMSKHNFQTIFTCLICKCKFQSSETFDQHQINCKSRSESCPTDDDHLHLSSNLSNAFLENDISSSNFNVATLNDVNIKKDTCDDKFQQYVINNKLDMIYSSIELSDSQVGLGGDHNTVSADADSVNDCDSSSSSYNWNHISEFGDDPIDKDYKPTEQKKKYTNRKTTSQKRARQKTTSQKTTSQKTASQKTTRQKKDSCKPFTCIFCENDFKRLGTLISHAIRIHKSHLCLICNKYFSSNKELKIHTDSSHLTGSDSHKDICSVCGDKLVGNGALNSHMVKHNFQTIFTCLICKCKFQSSETFDQHQINCKMRFDVTKDFESYTTSKCHISYQCTTCKKEMSASSLQSHMRIHTGQKPFVCEICGKAFNLSGNLQVHIYRHKGYKPHICSICGKRFTARCTLTHHLKTHTGERNYVCKICNKRFAHSHTLKNHINTHSSERPLKCTKCGRAFKANYPLKRHMLSHTKEQKFACQVCEKRFGRKCNLNVHMRIHNGLKPYSCGRCGLSFTYTQTLHNHTLKCK